LAEDTNIMEWIKQRVFDTAGRRSIWRLRDDGVVCVVKLPVGHPLYDTRAYVIYRFAKFALDETPVEPCSEKDFDKTFESVCQERKGCETKTWYSLRNPAKFTRDPAERGFEIAIPGKH
jgi:hypothetical protein